MHASLCNSVGNRQERLPSQVLVDLYKWWNSIQADSIFRQPFFHMEKSIPAMSTLEGKSTFTEKASSFTKKAAMLNTPTTAGLPVGSSTTSDGIEESAMQNLDVGSLYISTTFSYLSLRMLVL